MTFSLAQAQLFRTLKDARNLQIMSSTDLGQDRYGLLIAGEWYGRRQTRCYLVLRQGTQWQTIQLPTEWICDIAHLLEQPRLPEPGFPQKQLASEDE